MTNYERIKNMNTEEMAEFFCANFDFDIESAREMLNENFNAIYNDESNIENKIIKALEGEIHLAGYVDSNYCDGVNLSLIKNALDLISRLQAEVNRLQKYNTEVAYKHYNDGIKEFAERLKKPNRWRVEDIYYIDTLVKEMVGQH